MGDWRYKTKEKVKFNVSIAKNNVNLENVQMQYEVGPEMLPPTKQENLISKTESLQ